MSRALAPHSLPFFTTSLGMSEADLSAPIIKVRGAREELFRITKEHPTSSGAQVPLTQNPPKRVRTTRAPSHPSGQASAKAEGSWVEEVSATQSPLGVKRSSQVTSKVLRWSA